MGAHTPGLVIIGTGLAGYVLATAWRQYDPHTPLCLITEGEGAFYTKPLLSTACAQQKTPNQLLTDTVDTMREKLDATVLTHTCVRAVDTTQKHVHTSHPDFSVLPYQQLVFACGARPRSLSVPGGGESDAVFTVNQLEAYRQLRHRLDRGPQRVGIIGGGLVGTEFANDLCLAGHTVTVIDSESTPLSRWLPQQLGAVLRAKLEEAGIVWHAQQSPTTMAKTEHGVSLTLAQGQSVQVDTVLSAIGLTPHVHLAQQAGLPVVPGRGIVVDAYLRTAQQDVYALGDCAQVCGLTLFFVRPLRLCANALAKTLSGTPTAVQYPGLSLKAKTPLLDTVAAIPPEGVSGKWSFTGSGCDLSALFHDTHGALRGFALLGRATQERVALSAQLPPLLSQ